VFALFLRFDAQPETRAKASSGKIGGTSEIFDGGFSPVAFTPRKPYGDCTQTGFTFVDALLRNAHGLPPGRGEFEMRKRNGPHTKFKIYVG
jgi:hypothetical protein